MSTRFNKRRPMRLRHRVTFQRMDDTHTHGITTPTWENVTTVSADVMDTGGTANTRDDQLQEQQVTQVVIRKPRSSGWYPNVEMRISYGTRTLNIRRILDRDGTGKYLTIQCVEVASA